MADCEQFEALHERVAGSLDAVGRFLVGLLEAPQGEHRPPQLLALDAELQKFWKTYADLKQRHSHQSLQVAVLALTKSGKSTLLNSLTASSCLPSNNVPETARITKLIHTDLKGGEQPWLRDLAKNVVVHGQARIQEHLRSMNKAAREARGGDEAFLELHIPVAAVSELQKAGPASAAQAHQLTLLDTPGPNEAGEDALKAQVDRLLDSVDVCIYLLDYTKLKTQEEADMLKKLKGINPALIKRLQSRLFFVVNKADVMYNCEGLQEEETKQYVADLITSQLHQDGFQLAPEQVLLVSAQEAHLSRLMLNKLADAEQQRRFHRLAFGLRASKKSQEEVMDAAREFLEISGIQQLEERVLSFLFSHSGILKMLATLDDSTRMLHQVQNVACTYEAALRQGVEELQAEAGKLRAELEDTLAKFDVVQQQAEEVEAEVVDEVQARMQGLRERLFEQITAVLDPSEEASPVVKTGAWKAVWSKASAFFSRRSADSQAQQELQQALQELNADIQKQFESEVGDFWQGLEAATNARQHLLFHRINRHLAALARAIESTVGELLSVRLEAVPIRMEPPSAQAFHASLQDLLARGINKRTEERSYETEHDEVEYVKERPGICGMGTHWVGRPVRRTVQIPYQETIYELNRSEIQEYYIKMVDESVGTSIAYVRTFVRSYVSERIREARNRISEYGDKYQAAMLAALETSRQGEMHRAQALAMIAFHLDRLSNLQADLSSIQGDAAAMLPMEAAQQLADSITSAWTDADLPADPSADPMLPHPQPTSLSPSHAEPRPAELAADFVMPGEVEYPVTAAARTDKARAVVSAGETGEVLGKASAALPEQPQAEQEPVLMVDRATAALGLVIEDRSDKSLADMDPDVNGEFASPMPQPDTVLAESSTQQLAQLTLSAVPIPARQEAQAGSGKGSVLEPAIGSAAESSCCTSPAVISAETEVAGREGEVHHLHHPMSRCSSASSSEEGSADWELVSGDNNDGDDFDNGEDGTDEPMGPTHAASEPLTLRH